ncbi:2Fe-2S iron-sulfur cluster-binding protein [Halococcus qingdaonensis]|uniref:2Fe-2S iron-sulfur cluster-binding protein n=1 Tax=Halococcus qingdaonensis TaxID=224402 RepID=UPI002116D67A|nr:2Fe-2S iron-sulfur cluster-binding protein [Halococcus qingdaonensis]
MSHRVTIEFGDETHELDVNENEYVLDAGLDDGLDLPCSCREGNCTTCTGELLTGEIDQSDGMALDKEDREAGYVLLCSAKPRSDCRVRAGNEVQEELLGLDLF